MARFMDPHTVELEHRSQILTAKNFVIATGSIASRLSPPCTNWNATGYLTSDTALELTRLPRSLVVLGGGAVALEFAQFFARFGVKVTLIQRSPHVFARNGFRRGRGR